MTLRDWKVQVGQVTPTYFSKWVKMMEQLSAGCLWHVISLTNNARPTILAASQPPYNLDIGPIREGVWSMVSTNHRPLRTNLGSESITLFWWKYIMKLCRNLSQFCDPKYTFFSYTFFGEPTMGTIFNFHPISSNDLISVKAGMPSFFWDKISNSILSCFERLSFSIVSISFFRPVRQKISELWNLWKGKFPIYYYWMALLGLQQVCDTVQYKNAVLTYGDIWIFIVKKCSFDNEKAITELIE